MSVSLNLDSGRLCLPKPVRILVAVMLFMWVGYQGVSASGVKEDSLSHVGNKGSWYLKTSLPAWGAAIVNVAGEWDCADRWSLALDLGYSAWDYGKSTRKFRTFLFRPEARYWFSDGHKGWFAEGHLAMISYNVVLPDWKWRIQDAAGTHPALGGGFGFGYRFALGHTGRWHMECAVGGGVYALRYDKFENRRGGAFHDTVSKVWVGIDNVALSLVYTLNL